MWHWRSERRFVGRISRCSTRALAWEWQDHLFPMDFIRSILVLVLSKQRHFHRRCFPPNLVNHRWDSILQQEDLPNKANVVPLVHSINKLLFFLILSKWEDLREDKVLVDAGLALQQDKGVHRCTEWVLGPHWEPWDHLRCSRVPANKVDQDDLAKSAVLLLKELVAKVLDVFPLALNIKVLVSLLSINR